MVENCSIKEVFTDTNLISEIQDKLPKLFRIAEIEASRAGKTGMEVGSIREKIIIALLIYKFGDANINTNLPVTEPETDVILCRKEISIKTITKKGGVKAVWTVDKEKAKYFIDHYVPKCDILFAQIFWGTGKGGLFLIPLSVQKEIFNKLGRNNYLKAPKEGTNPRGVELSKDAITQMLSHKKVLRIQINWQKEDIPYDIYERWVDYWTGKETLS